MTHSTVMLYNTKQRIFTGLFLVNQPTVLFSVAAQCSDVSRLSFHFGPASSRLWPTVCNFAHFFSCNFCQNLHLCPCEPKLWPRILMSLSHGLWTTHEGINQRSLKIWADLEDKICFGCTLKIWEWEWIFGCAVKVVSSSVVRSPCFSSW